MNKFSILTKYVAIVGVTLIAFSALAYTIGARINATKSIPLGLYWVSNETFTVGSYVLFCPPPNEIFLEAKNRGYITGGFCPGNYGYMMKKIIAAKNGIVKINSDGLYINNKLIPYSKLIDQDGAGRPMPRYHTDEYMLSNNEILLMSDVSSISFDARYFGPIDISQIKTVILPVFTF